MTDAWGYEYSSLSRYMLQKLPLVYQGFGFRVDDHDEAMAILAYLNALEHDNAALREVLEVGVEWAKLADTAFVASDGVTANRRHAWIVNARSLLTTTPTESTP